METEQRANVVLADSLTIPGAVSIGRPDARGKVTTSEVFTREELQDIVQQAHDDYGITADPFATPGSADPDAWVDGDQIRHNGEVYERRRGHWSTGGVNRPVLDDRAAENTVAFYPNTTEVLRKGGRNVLTVPSYFEALERDPQAFA